LHSTRWATLRMDNRLASNSAACSMRTRGKCDGADWSMYDNTKLRELGPRTPLVLPKTGKLSGGSALIHRHHNERCVIVEFAVAEPRDILKYWANARTNAWRLAMRSAAVIPLPETSARQIPICAEASANTSK